MKKTIYTALAITLTVGALGMATSVAAHQRQDSMATFEAFDADGDGIITTPEMQAFAAAKFSASDANGDGFLDAHELEAQFMARIGERMGGKMNARMGERTPPMMDRMVDRMLSRADTDGDGMLNLDEGTGPRNGAMFAKVDADGDGNITLHEWENKPRMGPRDRMNN